MAMRFSHVSISSIHLSKSMIKMLAYLCLFFFPPASALPILCFYIKWLEKKKKGSNHPGRKEWSVFTRLQNHSYSLKCRRCWFLLPVPGWMLLLNHYIAVLKSQCLCTSFNVHDLEEGFCTCKETYYFLRSFY